jgi:predicted transcriptional regulator
VPKFLSEERIRLIHEIRKGDYTINELAKKLKRKRENISRDINLLKHLKLVEVRKNGREIHPATKPNITITL